MFQEHQDECVNWFLSPESKVSDKYMINAKKNTIYNQFGDLAISYVMLCEIWFGFSLRV